MNDYQTEFNFGEDYEVAYERDWKEYIEFPDGINLDRVKRELVDYWDLADRVSKVYCEITGGLLSKVTYTPETVLSVWNDYLQDQIEQEIQDRIDAGLLIRREQINED